MVKNLSWPAIVLVSITAAGWSAFTPVSVLAGLNSPIPYALTDTPQVGGTVAGDFNGDGKVDLAVSESSKIEVLLGHGDGTFGSSNTIATIRGAGHLIAADFNHDGRLDLAVTEPVVDIGGYTTGSAVTILLGNGDGTFTMTNAPISLPGTFADGLSTGDINHDGVPDIVVGTTGWTPSLADSVNVFIGNGNGAFTLGWSSAVESATWVAVADLNGDGLDDVVAAGAAHVTVLITKVGGFASSTQLGSASSGPLALADFNGDGLRDIAFGLATGGAFAVSINQGSGSFAAPTTYGLSTNTTQPRGIVAVDINRDGRPDLALAGTDGTLQTWVSLLDGTFLAANSLVVAPGSPNPAALDTIVSGLFNSDASLDFAVTAGSASGTTFVYVVLGNGLPSPPDGVAAIAGVGSATITWQAPADNAGYPVSAYRITSSGGATLDVGPITTSVVMAGLSPVAHTFTVTATNSVGMGPASAASTTVTPLPGGTYHPLVPARVLDTRFAIGVPARPAGPLRGGQSLDLQVTGQGGVPTPGVSSVVLNVTITAPTNAGFLSVWPQGSSRPLVSNLNWTPGKTVANLVEVAVGPTGMVSFFNPAGNVDVIADVQGYVGDSTDSYTRAGLFNPLPPKRDLDTRIGVGAPAAKLGPGATLDLTVTNLNGVPAAGVSAVILNVTAVGPSQAGFLTVWPAGTTRPTASNLNFLPNQVVPNRVMVGVGTGPNAGKVSIYNPSGTVDLVADVNGWFTDATSAAGGSAFVGELPGRIFDTRGQPGQPAIGPFPPRGILTLGPAPSDHSALVLNVTAVTPTAAGYLTLYPDNPADPNRTPPTASDLNFVAGDVVPNFTVVKLGSSSSFDTYNAAGNTDVVYDEDGYYGAIAPPPPSWAAASHSMASSQSGPLVGVQHPEAGPVHLYPSVATAGTAFCRMQGRNSC
jgi:FG-GAP-like repeat